jgi:hypothetical protein
MHGQRKVKTSGPPEFAVYTNEAENIENKKEKKRI